MKSVDLVPQLKKLVDDINVGRDIDDYVDISVLIEICDFDGTFYPADIGYVKSIGDANVLFNECKLLMLLNGIDVSKARMRFFGNRKHPACCEICFS